MSLGGAAKKDPDLFLIRCVQAQWDTTIGWTGLYLACFPSPHARDRFPRPDSDHRDNKYLTLVVEQNSCSKCFQSTPPSMMPTRKPTWFGDSVGRGSGHSVVPPLPTVNGLTRLDPNGHPHSYNFI